MKQKQTSALRRVDNLGRIVLPKEIRQRFRLSEGAEVLVRVEDEKIVVEVFDKFDNLQNLLDKVLRSFEKDQKVLICSKTKILAASIAPKNEEKLFHLIQKQEQIVLYDEKEPLFEGQKTLAIFPILSQGEFFGGLVVTSQKFIQNFDFVRPILKLMELSLSD